MLQTGRGVVRAARAALATLLVLGIGSLAHALGGGTPPGAMATVVLALLVGPVAWWCMRRHLGVLRLVALLGGAQVVVHLGLVAMAPGAGSASALHVHGGIPAGLTGGVGAAASPHMHHSFGLSMLVAHVVATVATALVLARAEDVLWRVVAILLPRTPGRLRLPPPVRSAPAPVLVVLSGRAPRPLGGRAPPLAPA